MTQSAIHFKLPELHSWKRPRTTRGGHMYNPGTKDLKAAKKALRAQAEEQGHASVSDSAWALTVSFVQSDNRKRDIDRLLSFTMDALEGALYENDSQVQRVLMEKHKDPTGANCVFVQAVRLA